MNTLAGCQAVLSGFERDTQARKVQEMQIQTAGGLLGSVIVPLAALRGMHTMAMLAGTLSGFANTEISVLRDSGLSALASLFSRDSVLVAMKAALAKHYALRAKSPLDYSALQAADDELKVACILYDIQSPTSQPIATP